MKRHILFLAVLGSCVSALGYAGVSTALVGQEHRSDPAIADARTPSVPTVSSRAGSGESLVLVVGGVYPTAAEASDAAALLQLGEFQGFYIAPTDDFAVKAAYADYRPETATIECSPSGMEAALSDLPELEQVSYETLEQQCDASAHADSQAHVSLALDAALERVDLGHSDRNTAGDSQPARCAPASTCLGQAPSILGKKQSLPAGQWMTVTAFRTTAGAEDFLTFLRGAGAPPAAMVIQAIRRHGSSDVGLGQEPSPDGTGALVAPLAPALQESLQK